LNYERLSPTPYPKSLSNKEAKPGHYPYTILVEGELNGPRFD